MALKNNKIDSLKNKINIAIAHNKVCTAINKDQTYDRIAKKCDLKFNKIK